jgi:phenol/toluene 2-monooxygenase (NADH) P0/A0
VADWGAAAVRVTGVRRSRFVEFEFSLDPDLVVELVLPYDEFREFCVEHHVQMLPADGEAALQLMELATE